MRYADDVCLLAGSATEMQEILDRIKTTSEDFGLYLHSGKTKAMRIDGDATDGAPDIVIGAGTVEYMHNFCYLGCIFNDEYDDTVELRKRLAMARGACQSLVTIWKDHSINRRLKVRLLRSPIATYGAETWVLTLLDRKKINSFELWCYRRALKLSWREKTMNEWVLEQIGRHWRLLNFVDKLKLQYFGHIARRNLEK